MTIAKNKSVFEEVGKEYETRRMALVEKYGEPNEEGDKAVTKENIKKFTDEVTAIQEEEVELDLKTVSIADLGKDLQIEPNIIEHLQWMITMVGQKPTPRKRK
jgi:hypothetical protein